MRYIGRWISSLKDTEYPPPQELVGEYDASVQAKIVDYLRYGHVLHEYRGFTSCLFRCNYSESYTEQTDGTWVWPCDLAHYVEAHNVLMPSDFINDIVASTGLPEFNEAWRSESDDIEYWRNWCSNNASGQLKDRIRAKLEAANHLAEGLMNAKAEEMKRDHGVSRVQCNWAGCTNMALSGRSLCGRCCLKGTEDIYVTHFFTVGSAIAG